MSPDEENMEFLSVITFDIGNLPGGDIGLRLHYATSQEKLDTREWEWHPYVMGRETAISLAKALLRATGELPPLPKAIRQ